MPGKESRSRDISGIQSEDLGAPGIDDDDDPTPGLLRDQLVRVAALN